MMLLGLPFGIAIIAGIVLLATWAARGSGGGIGGGWNAPSRQTPRRIFQARYARGEITGDQYQQMLEDLR